MAAVLEKQVVEAPQAEAPKKDKRKKRRSWFPVAASLTAWLLILAGYLMATRWDDHQFPASWMVMMWSPYWLALAAPSALLCLGARRWGMVLLHSGLTAAFLFLGGHYQVRSPLRPAGQGAGIKVMSYNVKGGLVAGIDAVASVIRQESPDVVLLQECWKGPIAKTLGDRLEGYTIVGEGSRLIATRLPVTSWNTHRLLEESRYGMTEALIETAQGPMVFMTIHQPSYNLRSAMVKGPQVGLRYPGMVTYWQTKLLKEMKAEVQEAQKQHPVILGGDFNCPPIGPRYDILDEVLDDSFAQAGSGFNLTFPSTIPGISIDRIWIDPRLTSRESRVVESEASDHRPLVTVFAPR